MGVLCGLSYYAGVNARLGGITDTFRGWKHRAFVQYKKGRYPVSIAVEPLHREVYKRYPYKYRMQDFAGLNLGPIRDFTIDKTVRVDRTIYLFWTGGNEITPNRLKSLQVMRRMNEDRGVQVALVTPENLKSFVVPEHPLHEMYPFLHVVHRSDYLRAYFLHFHGGGYSDIKEPTSDWSGAFDRFQSSSAWLMGDYKPSRFLTPAFADPRLERLMRRTSPAQVFQCGFIARPGTPLTSEWLTRLHALLDRHRPELVAHPGVGRFGGDHYPLPWTAILGQIIDPLTIKYASHVTHDASMRLLQTNYL